MSSNDHTYETTAPWTDANADAAFAQSFGSVLAAYEHTSSDHEEAITLDRP